MAENLKPVYPTLGVLASGYFPLVNAIPYASYPFPYPPPPSTSGHLRRAVAYQMYEEESNSDAHVIAFEQAPRANEETDVSEIVDLFGTTLKKGPQKWHEKFLRLNPATS